MMIEARETSTSTIEDTTMRYRKIRFYSKRNGETAGLVIQHDGKTFHSIEELSRLFPVSEAMKMERLQSSPIFNTWNEAFEFEFPSPYVKQED